MRFQLNQRERLIVSILYFLTLVLVFKAIGGEFDSLLGKASNDNVIWFFSGALMIVLGKYLTEAFFTKPTDALANSLAVIATLISLSDKSSFWAYTPILWYAIAILLGSIFCIAINSSSLHMLKKASQIAYKFVAMFGRADVLFSIVYLSASYSYFAYSDSYVNFIIAITFWIVLVFFDLAGLAVNRISGLLKVLNNRNSKELGIALGCENPFFYRVEVDLSKNPSSLGLKYGDLVAIETSQNIGSIGMIIERRFLLSKRWLSIYLLRDDHDETLKINLGSKKIITDPKSVFSQNNSIFHIELDSLEGEERDKIKNNSLYLNRKAFIGYIGPGSNISTINFAIIDTANDLERKISEGRVLQTEIYGRETLYQIINGNTKEEHLENFDSHGYVIGIARKLGFYNRETRLLETSPWLPAAYAPLFIVECEDMNEDQERDLASNFIGKLPNTNYPIPLKDVNSLVTHNTAILGILGIGKSCLTFELIKKILSSTEANVICFDITDEYVGELKTYGCSPVLLKDEELHQKLEQNYEVINKDVHRGGNHGEFREGINSLLKEYFEDPENQLLIINPDDYTVSRQTREIKAKKVGPGNNDWEDQAPMTDLTLIEKTRIIAEVILVHAKASGKSKMAKYLLVFEEAHSLVPEWNSVSYEGDKSATNGIAKVILQGRKYGLGSFVVTQRTANVSKSVLNQCNTIFALRVFDDTGKAFLENYIGSDYTETLATLEERHSIAIGKGLRIKQPVIVQLNDQKYVINDEAHA